MDGSSRSSRAIAAQMGVYALALMAFYLLSHLQGRTWWIAELACTFVLDLVQAAHGLIGDMLMAATAIVVIALGANVVSALCARVMGGVRPPHASR